MKQVYRADDVKTPSQKFKHKTLKWTLNHLHAVFISFCCKKRKEKEKWTKNEKGRVTERCKVYLYTGDQVRNHLRHACSVRGFKLSSKSFPGKVWIAHAYKNTHYFG